MIRDPLMPQLAEEIAIQRDELAAELAALVDERPAVKAAADTAKQLFEDRNHAYQSMQLRIARATRHGADSLTGAVARLSDKRLRDRDAAGGAMTRAVKSLENHDWRIGSLRAELAQLDLVVNPPAPLGGPRLEVVKRPALPFSDGAFEVIELPPAAAGPGNTETRAAVSPRGGGGS